VSNSASRPADSRPDLPDPRPARAGFRPAGAEESVAGNRGWWDGEAAEYYREHGSFLGDDRFVWGPEGLDEADAALLGPVAGRQVLEVGCGAAQCARWLARQGARVVGLDLSAGMLGQGRALGDRPGAPRVAGLVQADARRLPFADSSFEIACSAYGALPFVGDGEAVMREVARVLRPGGRWVFSLGHPVRWAFPDDPGPGGLTASRSYFDRTPYVEESEAGTVLYAEHHATLGDRIRQLTAAGLRLVDLVEPSWPAGHEQIWGGWSPLRGRLLPGTAVFVTVKEHPIKENPIKENR
jgi:SAM-dependent methyltransferase